MSSRYTNLVKKETVLLMLRGVVGCNCIFLFLGCDCDFLWHCFPFHGGTITTRTTTCPLKRWVVTTWWDEAFQDCFWTSRIVKKAIPGAREALSLGWWNESKMRFTPRFTFDRFTEIMYTCVDSCVFVFSVLRGNELFQEVAKDGIILNLGTQIIGEIKVLKERLGFTIQQVIDFGPHVLDGCWFG